MEQPVNEETPRLIPKTHLAGSERDRPFPSFFVPNQATRPLTRRSQTNQTISCLEARQPRRSRQKVCLTALGSHKPSVRPQHGLETVRSRPARIDTYFQPYNEKKYALLLAQSPTRLSTCRPHQSFRALVHSQSKSFVEGLYGQSIHLLHDHSWAVKLKAPNASEERYLSAWEGLDRATPPMHCSHPKLKQEGEKLKKELMSNSPGSDVSQEV